MTYRLPPLNALRAFEAAARHLSFKQAAAELHVTSGAVSQQVKALEDVLGVRLFDRIHNGLMLTVEGQQYLTPVRAAFTNISVATEMISPREGGVLLTIGSDPRFAVRWLVPKMSEFQRNHPDVRVRIGIAQSPDAIVQGDVDIAILRGMSAYAGLKCDMLLEEQLFPVCAPDYCEDGTPAFEETVLLVAEDDALWKVWLAAAGAPKLSSFERIDFTERSLAVRAALAGRGLVMGSMLDEAREIEGGHLIRPFASAVRCGGATYYTVYPPGRADCPAEKAFLDWLQSVSQEQGKDIAAA